MFGRIVFTHKHHKTLDRLRTTSTSEFSRAGSTGLTAAQFRSRSRRFSTLSGTKALGIFDDTYIYGTELSNGVIIMFQYLDNSRTLLWIECEPRNTPCKEFRTIIDHGVTAIKKSSWLRQCSISDSAFFEESDEASLGLVAKLLPWYGKIWDVRNLILLAAVYGLAIIFHYFFDPGIYSNAKELQLNNLLLRDTVFPPIAVVLYGAVRWFSGSNYNGQVDIMIQ